ncbi:porin [Asticcacaulis benevestitus]|uniref:porin n=1 Tax=Asticcacaulis benevestitus TaxID=347481 RepID=UPI00039CB2A2|nr:porin [Asticcacaulis benevestitus]
MSQHMRLLAGFTSVFFLVGVQQAVAQTTDWQVSGALGVASEGVSKDVGETSDRGQFKGSIEAVHGPVFISASLRNLHEAGGIDGQQEYVLGLKGRAQGFDLAFGGGYKIKTNAPSGFDAHFVEWQADVSRTFASGTTVRVTDVYASDAPGATQGDNWIEAGLSQVINAHWSVSGAVGTRRLTPKNDYSAVNLGATYALLPRTKIDLRYYDTDRHDAGDAFKSRLVLQLMQNF